MGIRAISFLLGRRRRFGASAMLCMAFAALASAASAQPYPSKAVRVIVPFGPGTAPDAIARVASDGLQKRLGQSFTVENRIGAGGKIGTQAAATATADGYTLFLGTRDSQSILGHLHPSWSVKPERQLTPIAGLARIDSVLLAQPAFPSDTLDGVLAMARTKELSYATPGVGTHLHLMGEQLKSSQGLQLLHVPYSKSAAEALPAVLRGDVDLLFSGLPPLLPFVQDARVKALAITGTRRSKFLPQVPTFAELGIPGLESGGWFGLFAPTGTPPAILRQLEAEINHVMQDPSFQSRLASLSAEPWAATPAQLSRTLEAERLHAGKLVHQGRIRAH